MAASTVDEYINDVGGPVAVTLQAARDLLLSTVPDLEEYMKWGAPSYRIPKGEQIFYLYGGKDHVNLGFLLGDQLDDPAGLLQGAGQKESRHVHLEDPTDIATTPALVELILQSVALAG